LALALARALIGSQEYPIEQVANHYLRWISSAPFDVGNATRMAMDCNRQGLTHVHLQMRANALAYNRDSKANGALMRSSPLGIWSVRLNERETVEAALSDAGLTHPNLTCQWANAAYVSALRHLMLFPGDASGAYQAALRALPEDQSASAGSIEVRTWLEDAQAGRLPSCHPMAGFVRIGFTHAFFHLLEESTFENALRETLAGGGDTDTNACIVGALVGALHGIDGIPTSLVEGVLHCDTRLGHARPAWLQAGDALELAAHLTVDTKRAAAGDG
jgi:ADP-ribosyl-[dinitrogen reductase] hydrolase